MRVLESKQLTILTTDQCTARCAHCSMNSSPHRRARLDADRMCGYIDQALESTAIRFVIFAGGEPLLLGEDLYRTLEHVRLRGMRSRVVTNGYWARTPAKASEVVRALRDAGLNELNLSIDDFHLPFVDARHVKLAFDAARATDFDAVIIVHCSGPNTRFNAAELDELLGERLPRMFDEEREAVSFGRTTTRPFVAVSNSTLQAIGRGAELDVGEVASVERWPEKARAIGGCPWAVRSPAITPEGRLVACCGFEVAGNPILDIGDLSAASLPALLGEADQDLPINMIALEGPYAIMDQLKELDPSLPFRPHYRSFCELCQDIVTNPILRRALLELMPSRAPYVLARRRVLAGDAG